ncbi:uncharacterized protein LOC141619065 [Silene latifolia]|uniref:uncharacterized protein LOC141619065 n=1 Tax=Silene latifolia TaxID=37657 RepID=UPI003D786166
MADNGSDVEQSDFAKEGWLWRLIWRVPVIPRIKAFIWQLCHDALPTRANLVRRLGYGDASCPRCHAMETCFHAIKGCGWGDEVWEEVGLEVGMAREVRNKFIFEAGGWDIGKIVRRIWELVWEMDSLRDKTVPVLAAEARNSRWERPGDGVSKVNTDAGVMEGVGVGLVAVSRYSEGVVEWACVVQREVCSEVAMAEAEAVLLGLKEARRMGSRRVIVESDSLEVIEDLTKKRCGRSELFVLYNEIRQFCLSFDFVVFKHVSRNLNSLAHSLAHARPWVIGRHFWLSDLPAEFATVAGTDICDIY